MDRQLPSDNFMQGGFGTSEDAALYLRVSIVTVRREVRRGRLKAYRVGGRNASAPEEKRLRCVPGGSASPMSG